MIPVWLAVLCFFGCFDVAKGVKLQIHRLPIVNASMLANANISQLTELEFGSQLPNEEETNLGVSGCELIVKAGEYSSLSSLKIRDGFLTPKTIKILAGITAPKLEQLILSGNGVFDTGFAALANSSLASSLKILRLDGAGLTSDAMKSLRNSNFPKLEELDISENLLLAEGFEQLSNASLPSLRKLYVGMTGIDSTAIEHISKWNLTSLELLSMRSTLFYPQDFDKLAGKDWSNLQHLELQQTPFFVAAFSRFVEMKLPNLKSLNLMMVGLESQHAEAFSKLHLPNLEVLNLALNFLQADDIRLLTANKPNLKKLDLTDNLVASFNSFDFLPAGIEEIQVGTNMIRGSDDNRWFSSFGELKLLGLRSNELEDEDVANILFAISSKLQNLELKDLPLKEKSLQAFANLDLSELKSLSFDECPFADRVTAIDGSLELPKLTHLYLTSTRIGEVGLRHIASNWKVGQNLEQLNMDSCHTTDLALSVLSKLPLSKLKTMSLQSSLQQLTGKGFLEFRTDQLESLETLSLSNNPIDLEGAKALSKLRFPNLRKLELTKCNMSEEAVIYLLENTDMPRLTELNLGQNYIGDATAAAIVKKGFERLTILSLKWSDITNVGFKLIVDGLPWLKSLDLSNVNITATALEGCRPEFFSNVEVLQLSNNMLGNEFVESLSKLQPNLRSLKTLNVAWNDLTPGVGKHFVELSFPWIEFMTAKEGNNLTETDVTMITSSMIKSWMIRLNDT